MKLPKPVSYALKLCITAGAFYLAISQVDIHAVMPIIASISPLLFITAFLLTHAAQILGALRTRYYLHCEGIDLPVVPSLQLHYVGGLFNAFLPGGAGGDAYKAWWLKRHKEGKLLNMMKLMIAGRLNGLWALGIVFCAFAFLSDSIRHLLPYASLLIVATAIAGTLFYALFARYVLKEPYMQQFNAGIYSLVLQGMLGIAAYLVAIGLGLSADAIEYSALFMLSCILAMAPISIGGVGVRELALLYGSRMLNLSEEHGVSLAFTFTILTLTVPVVGAVIHTFFAPEGKQTTYETP